MADPVATQLTTGTSTTATTTVNFTAQTAGKLLVLVVGADDYRATTGTGRPESTGWTLPTGASQQHNAGHYLWYKITDGSETSVQYKIGSASGSGYWLGVVTNIDTTTPLDISNGSNTAGGNTGTSVSVTSTTGRRIAIASFCTASGPAVITDHTSWTNSYTEIGEVVQTVGTQDRTSVANLVFDGGGATSTGATFSGGSCDTQSNIVAVFKNASASGTTDTARVGGTAWAGVKAASAASVIGLASLGGLTWSGVRANSTTAVTVTDTAKVGGLAWSGVRAQSAADVTHQARVGSLALGGVAPVLSIEDVVDGTGPGALAWSGVRAQSTALGGGVTDTARVGSAAWSGVAAASAADVIATGRVGGVTWVGVKAASVADLTNPARPAALAWSGITAASTTAVVQVDNARVGIIGWAGVPASSAATVLHQTRVGELAWSGVRASSVASATPTQDVTVTLIHDRSRLVSVTDRSRTVAVRSRS